MPELQRESNQYPDARLATRQNRSISILARIDDWLTHHCAHASAKSPLGVALAYIAKHRDGHGRFLTDGRVEIDNGSVERTIRPFALNRNTALFAGHDAGAENRADISLIETCNMNGIDPHAWIAATLTAIAQGHKRSRINDLLPWLCCTNRVRDSSRESNVVAAGHEQTHAPRLQDPELA